MEWIIRISPILVCSTENRICENWSETHDTGWWFAFQTEMNYVTWTSAQYAVTEIWVEKKEGLQTIHNLNVIPSFGHSGLWFVQQLKFLFPLFHQKSIRIENVITFEEEKKINIDYPYMQRIWLALMAKSIVPAKSSRTKKVGAPYESYTNMWTFERKIIRSSTAASTSTHAQSRFIALHEWNTNCWFGGCETKWKRCSCSSKSLRKKRSRFLFFLSLSLSVFCCWFYAKSHLVK